MSNAFTNFLAGVADGSGDMHDYQHAARLYADNFYELAPKNGWIYYVRVNLNPKLLESQYKPKSARFEEWYGKRRGQIGLLVKNIDLPKFTIDTEIVNQYNRKTLIQKKINYSPVGITFHDDMANVTTDLWRHYYEYYFSDSVDSGSFRAPTSITPKYTETKFNEKLMYKYGLDNNQQIPFFLSIDIYQLNKQRYTKFRLINPIIKEWAHDQLDQTQGNRLMTSKMTVDYETVIYGTNVGANKVSVDNPGFIQDHYDRTPSPLSIAGNGNNSLLGEGGILAGADEVFGGLTNPDASPLDLLNSAVQGANLLKNAKNITPASLLTEGYSVLNSTLKTMGSQPVGTFKDGKVSMVPGAAEGGTAVSSTPSNPAGFSFGALGAKLNNLTQSFQIKLG